MDLGDRRRGDRRRVDRGEDLRGRPAEFLPQDLLDLVERERANIITKPDQLVDIRLGEQVRPGAQQLPQFHKSRSEILEDEPEPSCPILRRDAVPQRDPLDRPHQPLEVERRDHILIAVPHQCGQNLPITRQVAEMTDRFSNHTARPSQTTGAPQTPQHARSSRRDRSADTHPKLLPSPGNFPQLRLARR